MRKPERQSANRSRSRGRGLTVGADETQNGSVVFEPFRLARGPAIAIHRPCRDILFDGASNGVLFSSGGAELVELGRRTGASLDTASTEHKVFGLATVRCSSTSPIVLPSQHNPLMVHPKAIPWGCEAQAEGRQKECTATDRR